VLTCVRGTVYNYFSYGHKSLHLFRTATFKTPIGIGPLLDVENREKAPKETIAKYDKLTKKLRIVNINANNPLPEVLKYKENFDRMLRCVNLQN
jgi:hypothetical protein